MSIFQHTPVEPFGGLDNFDASETHLVYTAKDPKLPEAWHTKQNVRVAQTRGFLVSTDWPALQIYLVDLKGGKTPKELTSGQQGKCIQKTVNITDWENVTLEGATANPVFNPKGDKVAWLEMEKGAPFLSVIWATHSWPTSQTVMKPIGLDNWSSPLENFLRRCWYRNKIVIYDLNTDVRFILPLKWDRSPQSLAVRP
jgi:hypothetical protein